MARFIIIIISIISIISSSSSSSSSGIYLPIHFTTSIKRKQVYMIKKKSGEKTFMKPRRLCEIRFPHEEQGGVIIQFHHHHNYHHLRNYHHLQQQVIIIILTYRNRNSIPIFGMLFLMISKQKLLFLLLKLSLLK